MCGPHIVVYSISKKILYDQPIKKGGFILSTTTTNMHVSNNKHVRNVPTHYKCVDDAIMMLQAVSLCVVFVFVPKKL
jgi:hypothetical protein